MNSASQQDARVKVWSRLMASNPPVWVKTVRVIESAVFERQEIHLEKATCIVGSHGAGKTLLLRLIEAALGSNSRTPPFVGGGSHFEPDVKPLTGVVELVLSVKGGSVSAVVDLSTPERERAAIWTKLLGPSHWPTFVSSAELANDFIWYYQQFSSGVDRPVRARDFTPAERTAVRAILGRTYDSIRMQTILLDGSDDGQWFSQGPYVTAVSDGVVADNTTFSLGELWVYRVLWELERLQPGCLFMMDEPESFLALRGHRPLVDEVARRALGGNLQLLIATHSPQVLSRFPVASVRVCVRGPGEKVVIMKAESSEQVRRIVGMEVPVETLILVEDEFAAFFLSEIFACLGLPVAGIEIVPAAGEGNVKSGVRALLRVSRIRVFGVLDADQRHLADESKNLYSLPGEFDPEKEILDFALKNHVSVAGALGRTPESLLAALDGHLFLDHQYWPRRLAVDLGLDQRYVTSVLVRLWLQQPDRRQQAHELAVALVKTD
ncbi:ATP-dependent endonuclease [Micromonospora sp. S-DT3-3-22]|uniref:ATP-dependent nuclease n=1 Tax=Micromonospora sp. S-DT3-3-22 TaxID=2755359 RepID=UPI00188F82F6|nr:hypothetical protein [Micromonospora sp. S-DT3-3-22]